MQRQTVSVGELVSRAGVVSLSASGPRRGPTGVDSSALALPFGRLPPLPGGPGEQRGTVQRQHSGSQKAPNVITQCISISVLH